jgi:hypothetical protein
MQIDPGEYRRQSISDHAMAKWKEKHNGGIFEEGPAQASRRVAAAAALLLVPVPVRPASAA